MEEEVLWYIISKSRILAVCTVFQETHSLERVPSSPGSAWEIGWASGDLKYGAAGF
jgi:hypothetical protein